jgi:hypothetical protein
VERRRRVPRRAVGWQARYAIGLDPTGGWRACDILDISLHGAGLFVADATLEELDQRHLTVRVRRPEHSMALLTLVGAVRNLAVIPGSGLRVGLEFVGLSEADRAVLEALAHMEST